MTPSLTRARHVLVATALTLGVALAATACGGSAAPASAASAGSGAATTATSGVEEPTMSGGVQVLHVTGDEKLEFLQTRLAAKAGIPVRIDFTVTGGVPHNLTLLDGPKAATPTFSSGTRSLTVTFARPGTYHYQCTIHPASMNGTITVS